MEEMSLILLTVMGNTNQSIPSVANEFVYRHVK